MSMELEFRDGAIVLHDKVVNMLDRFVFDFLDIAEPFGRYCLVSGYVAILFGRTRGTEDVDLFISRMDRERFLELHRNLLAAGFEFVNPEDGEGLFDMLDEGLAIRAARKGVVIPNMEMKFPREALDEATLEGRQEVRLDDRTLFISPLELQIAYKLLLGSEKDIEDAIYIFGLMREHLDPKKLEEHKAMLNVSGEEHGI
jgi:hypothetical protein